MCYHDDACVMEVAASEDARPTWAAYRSCHKGAEFVLEYFRAQGAISSEYLIHCVAAEIWSEYFRKYCKDQKVWNFSYQSKIYFLEEEKLFWGGENNWFITRGPTLKTGPHDPLKSLMPVTGVLCHQAQCPGQNSHQGYRFHWFGIYLIISQNEDNIWFGQGGGWYTECEQHIELEQTGSARSWRGGGHSSARSWRGGHSSLIFAWSQPGGSIRKGWVATES